jgi:CubicO group peptidase (beta-lactamase class C family)
MRKWLRYGLWTLAALLALLAVAAAWNWDKIVRLNNVNTLFTEEKIVANFSRMKELFYWTPVKRSGETVPWPVAQKPIATQYLHEGEMKSVADWLDLTRTTSLLVIHDGAIAHEEYRLGTEPQDLRVSWSVAKSFLSAMMGIAVADGRIPDLDRAVDSYEPSLKGTVYEGVSLRNVLHMASGVRFNEDYIDFNSDINRMGRVLAIGGSMDDFARGLAGREREAGVLRQYTSIDTHILGMVLRAVTGKDLPALMEENLWAKLGVESDAYYLTDSHGVAFALGGLNITTRDYARFGWMMLDKGRFNGAQVIPEQWAVESVKASAPASANPDDPFGYGYQWWVPVNADDEFYAIGIYGQFVYVNRPARVVVVKTSAHRGFTNDGAGGNRIEAQTIEMFRAIASGLSGWTPRR